jgi:hypothetical protein
MKKVEEIALPDSRRRSDDKNMTFGVKQYGKSESQIFFNAFLPYSLVYQGNKPIGYYNEFYTYVEH